MVADHVHAAETAPAMLAIKDDTLRMLAWARLWSPLSDETTLSATWEALALPGSYAAARIEYWNTFHAGVPQPPVPLQLHALADSDGSTLRESLLRVAEHLEVETSGQRLPPDHLTLACELYALAIEREEPVLVAELMRRCIAPWAEAAQRTVQRGNASITALLEAFLDDARSAAT